MAVASPELKRLRLAVALALADEEEQAPPSPLAWATEHARIVTPSQGVAPWEPYKYQERLLEDHAPRRLVLKARQTGLSTAIALEALYHALHHEYDRTLFVSRNQELAGLLIRYCQAALAGLSEAVRPISESQSKLVFSNGSEIVSLPANPATGRGYPASRVYLDEFAFAEYDTLIMQGIAPTLSTGGQLTVLSTPKGRNNLFFRLWQGFEGGEWSRHSVHWRDCPRYTDAWAERQRAEMTRQAFAEEFDLDFISSGDAVFDPADLLKCREGYVAGREGVERYLTAWDIGRRQDHSVGITLGQRGEVWHVVKAERFLESYPAIQARIERRAGEFPGTHTVESNGVGDPVIENLLVRVDGFTTTPKSKLQAIQALQLLIQHGQFKYDPADEVQAQLDRELSLYEWADQGLVQDCVMAAAIAAIKTKPAPEADFY